MAFSLVTASRGCRQLDRHLDGQRAAGLEVGLSRCRSDLPSNLYGKTIRQVARVSIGGNKVRIVVSNEYGKVPLKIGAAHVGADRRRPRHPARLRPRADLRRREPRSPFRPARLSSAIRSTSPWRRCRNCRSACTSPKSAPADTMHWDGHQTAFVAAGNKVGETALDARLQADAAGVPVGDPGGCAGRTRAPS